MNHGDWNVHVTHNHKGTQLLHILFNQFKLSSLTRKTQTLHFQDGAKMRLLVWGCEGY